MRLLFIIPSTARGGVEEYTLTMTSAAVREGLEVHVAFPKAEGTVSLVKDLLANGVQYHQLEIPEYTAGKLATVRKYLPYFVRTVFLLQKLKPNVVQIVLPNPEHCLGSILACGFLKIPTVVRFGLVHRQISFSNVKLKAYAWARARNQRWLAISENNRQLVCKSFDASEDTVSRIYNGSRISLDSEKLETDRQTLRAEMCQELGIATDSKIALTVGRLDFQKGYQDLIPVIPHVVKEFPDLKFIWVGEGELRERLVDSVQEYGITEHVCFLGYRSDIGRLLTTADLFVFPTRFEGGQSFALAEAMAYALPIVTSKASGIPEVIEHGVHGLLFRVADSCDLMENLRWALSHLEQMQEMGWKAKLRSQEFSEARMIRETLDLWQKVSSSLD
ncbi:glycosyltransferase family 4 protein [Leptolyngbya sp. FACHB-261]|uniref:glycosyltransferase family 4 protein n=1 Tax=Leptolyngbya sp. FACHB-261 TaxID=2692806 RepID=UPI001683788C|nr:glycosyltransferase family 4 protein [Leptolyngbya sp. FACHB-261]MBD2101131.1 glycosyltransferase family 4 protein [Leptolyngbya sp. FACHB-261]